MREDGERGRITVRDQRAAPPVRGPRPGPEAHRESGAKSKG